MDGKSAGEELTERSFAITRVNLSTEALEPGEAQVGSFFSTPAKGSLKSPVSVASSYRPKKPRRENIDENDQLLATCEYRHRIEVQQLCTAISRQKQLNSAALVSLCLATYPALKAARQLTLRSHFLQWKATPADQSRTRTSQYLIRYETGIKTINFLFLRREQRCFTQLYERADTLSLSRTYMEMQEGDWKRREIQSRLEVKKDAYQAKRPTPLAFV